MVKHCEVCVDALQSVPWMLYKGLMWSFDIDGVMMYPLELSFLRIEASSERMYY